MVKKQLQYVNIAKYLTKKKQPDIGIWPLIAEYNKRNIFLNSCRI